MIYGETGTGKELVARCLHDHSERRRHTSCPLNCGGLPEALAESELFGHEAGAFTGADRVRVGKFEHAHGGTLFLDEIESMPLAVQVKLLRALQERSIERIGSNKAIPFDCRVVAASKDDLQVAERPAASSAPTCTTASASPSSSCRRCASGARTSRCCSSTSRCWRPAATSARRRSLSQRAAGRLMAYAWPGNVRELRNVADRFVLGLLGDRLTQVRGAGERAPALPLGLPQQVEHFERAVIVEELRRHRATAATADALGHRAADAARQAAQVRHLGGRVQELRGVVRAHRPEVRAAHQA